MTLIALWKLGILQTVDLTVSSKNLRSVQFAQLLYLHPTLLLGWISKGQCLKRRSPFLNQLPKLSVSLPPWHLQMPLEPVPSTWANGSANLPTCSSRSPRACANSIGTSLPWLNGLNGNPPRSPVVYRPIYLKITASGRCFSKNSWPWLVFFIFVDSVHSNLVSYQSFSELQNLGKLRLRSSKWMVLRVSWCLAPSRRFHGSA